MKYKEHFSLVNKLQYNYNLINWALRVYGVSFTTFGFHTPHATIIILSDKYLDEPLPKSLANVRLST